MNYLTHKISVETYMDNNEGDDLFFSYLDEYSIDFRITESLGPSGFPIIEYTGGPISLHNMLSEKFGMSPEEIGEAYPEVKRSE